MTDVPPPARPTPGSIVWLDGELVDADTARISPFDHGITVGDGVFETLKVVGGTPFAMRRHLERLERSATALGLACPDHALVREAAASVVAANGGGDARLRITLTGGPGPLGSNRGDGGPTLLLAVSDLPPSPPTTDVVTVDWVRNERGALTGLKTTSYAENVMALSVASAVGATEAIFANTVGNLCEGTGSNVFVVLDGRLVTPPLSAGPLAGITRDLVLEVTDAVEEDVPLAALAEAEEAFLTSSTRDVQAIAHVDGRALPAAPGPVTTAAAAAFARLFEGDLDP
ncbi:aminotransferase class IV [Actinomarinicola tropica]|uniref:4-amino-4-deoxychorismate lyase n=1 Tax=Actinomarinicola tropica TaxID=2789776 RepID=A0A5Q2RPM5_9ACTN|nr:aminotransferase class IV [Actinomarinicola tropica]QGG95830.1 4-amino-4-deoxychorismate lyase [Actinomarinicola tropica]